MLQCPVCRTIYTDTSLRYCLTDRAELVPVEQETIMHSATRPLRVDIPRADVTAGFPQPAPTQPKGGFPIVKVLIGVVALVITVAVVVGIIGSVIYFSTSGTPADQNAKKAPPSPSATALPSVDPDKQRLEDQLANMQKQLDEQKNANRGTNPPAFPTPANQTNPGVVTARVNSPGDGFLAMRSEPSADYGDRIAKIPHGAIVTIENCERDRIRIGSRTGRWCMVTWGNNVGWVFDAWLDY